MSKLKQGALRGAASQLGAFILAFAVTAVLTSGAQSQTPVTTAPPPKPPTPVATVVSAPTTAPTTIVLDSFDSVSHWTATPADGVEISVHADSNGVHGRAMRVDFDFHGHGGYAVIHRPLSLTLPPNYEFSFAIKGDAPSNTLEFKMIDSTGENVWWSNTPNFQFPKDWQTFTRKKRQISFAWGPTNDKTLTRFSAIEIAITAGSGGKGSVWLDDLAVTPLEPDTHFYPAPTISASSQVQGYDAWRAIDADAASGWRSAPLRTPPPGGTTTSPGQVPPGAETIDIDFTRRREFGGLVINWEPGRRANSYEVQDSQDKQTWQTLYRVNRTSAWSPAQVASSSKSAIAPSPLFRDYLYVPESDARYLRIVLLSPENKNGYGIRDIGIKPLEWAATENDFFTTIAREAPRGSYPRPFLGEQSYWTVVGVDRDSAEALINEEGTVEVGRAQFSIEPFLFADGKLITWNDVKTSVTPNREALPLPQVNWSTKDLDLDINAFAGGPSDSSVLFARYHVTNNSKKYKKLTLFLALRPFQVNPPWQFLNLPGGVARVDTISLQGSAARVTGNKFVRSLNSPSGFGAVTFSDGNIVDWLRAGKLPSLVSVTDPAGHASAAFAYEIELGPHATSSPIDIAVPLHGGDLPSGAALLPGQGERMVAAQLEKTQSDWREKLGRVSIALPPSASRYTETMRAQLADILINRDGPAIQPGSRSYSRSWIRDGSLTSTALLRLGHAADVKDFMEWYAQYQYDNGKVPC
ncbi:MAG TPA: discoidin domain-containing protein, partial [Gemmatimonadaceae bacterium]